MRFLKQQLLPKIKYGRFLVFLADATLIWLHSADSVNFVQGESARLKWTVDVGSGFTWDTVEISRNKDKAEVGKQKIIRLIEPTGRKDVYLTDRTADLELNVTTSSNIVNFAFEMRSLSVADEMVYSIFVMNSDRQFSVNYTEVIVNGE